MITEMTCPSINNPLLSLCTEYYGFIVVIALKDVKNENGQNNRTVFFSACLQL